MALQRLKEASEKAKHELSSALETEINIPFITVGPSGGPLHLERTLRRNELEVMVAPLIERTITCLQGHARGRQDPGRRREDGGARRRHDPHARGAGRR